ncbi:dihydroorotate dehydrogenase electron transfer subunit [Candidatus Peregrinibacteria bacterium]|nr:dihydroorotate dehydrogenase electron transfer subunit [Candidatus Peregrinibacteria bacterium]
MKIRNLDTRPITLEIKDIMEENPHTKTFVFEFPLSSEPGQFVMLWLPGSDEKPFSIAFDDGNEFWLTICKVGEATDKIFELEKGDKVGIRGPYGTSYEFEEGEKIALVSGGYGAAPMFNVAKRALEKGASPYFFIGARNEDLLLYRKRVKDLDIPLHLSTDDGSVGHKGYITEVLLKEMDEIQFDRIFACGPELMMKAVGKIAEENKVKCALSVEKYMKCGFGVCGQCTIDDSGECVCTKGPVMDWDYIKNLPEFGAYHRDAQGNKHYFR